MQSRIQKWGNSLAVRIPKVLADEVGLTNNTFVELAIKDGQIVIRPILAQQYRLDDLLAQITDDNLHGEINTGNAIGKETA
jgi:antitoxin MazE